MSGFEATIAAAGISAVGTVVAEGVKQAINREHSKNLPEIIKDVDDFVRELEALRIDCNDTIGRNRLTMKTTRTYDLWSNDVEKFLQEVGNVKNKYKENVGRVRNPFRHRGYKKKMIQKSSEGETLLLRRGQKFIEGNKMMILADAPPEPVLEEKQVPNIQGFPTLEVPLKDTIESLGVRSTKVIVICGILGVGKSTVLRNLNNHPQVARDFEMVIFLNANAASEESLRRAIAERLRLDKQGITNPDSKKISEVLKDKKCLLLLDNVTKKKLNLDEIGIPGNNADSKVVLTARLSHHLCRSINMPTEVIQVHPLSVDEAWTMFQDKVGRLISLLDIEGLARQVLDECVRLPLLIKAVADSFGEKRTHPLWTAGLKDLQQRREPKIDIQAMKEVHEFMMSCYDQLKDETTKKCFLYTALFPACSKIYKKHLLESWTEEAFFDHSDNIYTKLELGSMTLKRLTDVLLLEKGDQKMIYVWMNNCIQEFALYLASKDDDCKFLVKTGARSPEPYKVEDWEQAKRISMINNKLCGLMESSNCQNLLTLLLQRNSGLEVIPPSFFEGMANLLVLDLYATGIQSLPPSLSSLEHLKALYLNDCYFLSELPEQVSKLRSLEVLDIRGTRINFIPRDIVSLCNHLKTLRMSYIKFNEGGTNCQGKKIDVISKLQVLEELIINVIFYKKWCNEVVEVIKQLAALRKLTHLRFCFPNIDSLRTFVQRNTVWRDELITSFRFFVGCRYKKRPEILENLEDEIDYRYLRYCDGELNRDKDIIPGILARSQAMELIGHRDISRLSDLGIENLKKIHGCLIEKCASIATAVVGSGTGDGVMLPILQQLLLRNLPNLKSIFEGCSLSSLKVLELKDCPELMMIVSKLRASSSSQMLPQLETDESFTWPSLEVLKIDGCPELKSLPFNKDNAPLLRVIEVNQQWWDGLQCQNVEVKSQLETMCHIKWI